MALKNFIPLLLCLALVGPAPSSFAQEASGSVKPAGQAPAAAPDKSDDSAPKTKKKKKGKSAKKNGKEDEPSKYLYPNTLSDGQPRTYRFDANGNPIDPEGAKKPAGKKKKKKKAAEEDEEKSDGDSGGKSEDKSEESKDDSSAKACTSEDAACSAVGRN